MFEHLSRGSVRNSMFRKKVISQLFPKVLLFCVKNIVCFDCEVKWCKSEGVFWSEAKWCYSGFAMGGLMRSYALSKIKSWKQWAANRALLKNCSLAESANIQIFSVAQFNESTATCCCHQIDIAWLLFIGIKCHIKKINTKTATFKKSIEKQNTSGMR